MKSCPWARKRKPRRYEPSRNRIVGMGGDRRFRRLLFLFTPLIAARCADGGRLLWVTYGVLINASPVIVANVLVFSAAAWTTFRRFPAAGPGKA